MKQPQLETTLSVADVLARWPQTIRVFMRYRLACVGCVLSELDQCIDQPETQR